MKKMFNTKVDSESLRSIEEQDDGYVQGYLSKLFGEIMNTNKKKFWIKYLLEQKVEYFSGYCKKTGRIECWTD